MKTIMLISAFVCATTFSHSQDRTPQFLLIVRYTPGMATPSAEALNSNSQHWVAFMGGLAQSGELVTGYRSGTDGKTIFGVARMGKDGAYASDKEVVSSIIVIRAAGMDEASAIAQKCPIYEFDGSVEIRPVLQTTN
jgi:hypothetical protein